MVIHIAKTFPENSKKVEIISIAKHMSTGYGIQAMILTAYNDLNSWMKYKICQNTLHIPYILRRKSLVSTDSVCNNFVRQS